MNETGGEFSGHSDLFRNFTAWNRNEGQEQKGKLVHFAIEVLTWTLNDYGMLMFFFLMLFFFGPDLIAVGQVLFLLLLLLKFDVDPIDL